jgi:uncharacterized RDD family membrane protein YckC
MEVRFAGFWVRFVAYIIDSILLSVMETVVFVFVAMIVGIAVPFVNEPETTGHYAKFVTAAVQNYPETYEYFTSSFIGLFGFVSVVLSWLYFAGLQSSEKQATFGKAAMGLIVVDENLERLTFARASLRYFAKFISSMLLYFGYIMAAFTRHKRALHDILAGTYVVHARKSVYY